MGVNQKIIAYLRDIGVITHYKLKEDKTGNIKYIYYMTRNLTEDEASILRRNGIPVTSRPIHKGLNTMYKINNNIRTGKNHPFISGFKGDGMTDCFDPDVEHELVDDNDLYNICKEEYVLRKCRVISRDSCNWLKDRILTIKAKNQNVYDYTLIRDTYPMPPAYSSLRSSPQSKRSRIRRKSRRSRTSRRS